MNRFPKEESYRFAQFLAKKIALDLDADDYSSLPALVDLLIELPVEEVLWAIRHQIGIERCVCHDLDRDGPFLKLLLFLNEAVKKIDSNVQDQDPYYS